MSTRFYLKTHLIKKQRKKSIAKFDVITTFLLLLLLISFAPKNVFAWAGYEETTNIAIDIPPGNLVRIGREVDIFDFSTESYHPSEVIFLDDIFSGTRLEVKDLETNEKRIFYMERE